MRPRGDKPKRRVGFLLAGAVALILSAPPVVQGAGFPSELPPAPERILETLRKEHPRLLATKGDFGRVKRLLSESEAPRKDYAALLARAERVLSAPVSRYEIPDGLRLLATSRRVLERAYLLAFVTRVENAPRFQDRLWRELEAATAFPDWNPRHFLDTSEMTHAFAIAYDWLYDTWTPQQRAVLRMAIVKHGLEPALALYRGEKGWWVNNADNWNTVCNGGIALGALSIADEEPKIAQEIVHAAVRSVACSMQSFAPDGAWVEGPGYWDYATQYAVTMLAGLESALGTDYGLGAAPGFSRTALFPIYMTGPAGLSFNFADAGVGGIRPPQTRWLARKFNLPAANWFANRGGSTDPLDLLWRWDKEADPVSARLPLDVLFDKIQVAAFRSSWDDPNALYVGLKAGRNGVSHGHLDLGSFVLEASGVRWAEDLEPDDYNLPGYFGRERWAYYRLRPEGHNTLVIHPDKGPGQDLAAAASVDRFVPDPENPFAIMNLTPAYSKYANRVWRGVRMPSRKQALVVDEVEPKTPSEVWWFLHTRAEAELSQGGRCALMRQRGKSVEARILAPEGAAFLVQDARPLPSSPNPPGQNTNEGIRKLAIRLESVRNVRIAVLFTPGGASSQPASQGLDLSRW